MDAFAREVAGRLPLAEAVWTLLWHVADEGLLGELFERHRGTGCEREVRFALLVELVAGALVQHAGSGRRSFQAAREAQRLAATNEAVYGKLRRLPVTLSEAFVRETTRRLRQVLMATVLCAARGVWDSFETTSAEKTDVAEYPEVFPPRRLTR